MGPRYRSENRLDRFSPSPRPNETPLENKASRLRRLSTERRSLRKWTCVYDVEYCCGILSLHYADRTREVHMNMYVTRERCSVRTLERVNKKRFRRIPTNNMCSDPDSVLYCWTFCTSCSSWYWAVHSHGVSSLTNNSCILSVFPWLSVTSCALLSSGEGNGANDRGRVLHSPVLVGEKSAFWINEVQSKLCNRNYFNWVLFVWFRFGWTVERR